MPTMIEVDQYKSTLTPQQVDAALKKIAGTDIADFLTGQEAQNTYAPKNHASPATTYGTGNSSQYGHVKLSDAPGSSGASSGIAATPKAVQQALQQASDSAMFRPGDTFSTSMVCAPGFITTAGTELWASVPLPKPVSDEVSGVRITGGQITTRGVDGYVIGSASSAGNLAALSVTAAVSVSNIRFIISDGLSNPTNNTPAVSYITDFTAVFS